MVTQLNTSDPFAVAFDPPPQISTWYGRMSVNAWFCALVKGVGRVPFVEGQLDPNTSKPVRRNTAIDLSLQALSNEPMDPLERNAIAEFGEWVTIILPSMKEVGLTSLQALNQAWVTVELVPTGKKYTNSSGETKDSTTFKIVQVFADEASCKAAWQAHNAGAPAPAPTNGNGANAAAPAAAAAPNNTERETALKFAKAYVTNAWRQSGKDLAKAQELLGPMLAGQALIAKHFTSNSPEILDMLTAMTIPF